MDGKKHLKHFEESVDNRELVCFSPECLLSYAQYTLSLCGAVAEQPRPAPTAVSITLFPLLHPHAPSSIPFFELHRQNLLQRLVRQVQGVWRLGFHGNWALLLPDSSSGGDRRESKRKSLNVPISMQGQGCCGRQCSQRRAPAGMPGLCCGPGEDESTGIWVQQAGAYGQLPLAGAARRIPHQTLVCSLTDELSGIIHTLQAKRPRNSEAPNFLLGRNKGRNCIFWNLCIW